MSDTPPGFGAVIARLLSSGAIGVGLVLVAIPTGLLFLGAQLLSEHQIVGLPLLAIFGIMILFGSLALVAMLFKNLELTDARQPLALPEGSIRAAIALSLIVLFAIISIMLFHSSSGTPFKIDGLTEAQRNDLILKTPDRIISVSESSCAAKAVAESTCYVVMMQSPIPAPMVDIAKQLLILVGTLMTSVTSYYFAARSLNPIGHNADDSGTTSAGAGSANTGIGDSSSQTPVSEEPAEAHVDGCDVAITDVTPDHELPPARGGVEATRS